MHYIGGALATFIVCATLASADCWWIDPSFSCDYFDGLVDPTWACNLQCEMQGDNSGWCEPRPDCQYDYSVCVCSPAKKKRGEAATVDDGQKGDPNILIEVEEFLRSVAKDPDGDVDAEANMLVTTLKKHLDGDGDVEVERLVRELTNDRDGDVDTEIVEFIIAIKKYLGGDGHVHLEEFLRANTKEEDNSEDSDNNDDIDDNDDNDKEVEEVEARNEHTLGKRTISCGFPAGSSWICHAHCFMIGQGGGSCNSIDNVCICYG